MSLAQKTAAEEHKMKEFSPEDFDEGTYILVFRICRKPDVSRNLYLVFSFLPVFIYYYFFQERHPQKRPQKPSPLEQLQ